MHNNYIVIPEKEYLEILQKLDVLAEYVLSVKTKNNLPLTLNDWISEAETIKLIGKKKTTLYYLRKAEKLIFSKVGKTTFYSLKSIQNLLNNYKDGEDDK